MTIRLRHCEVEWTPEGCLTCFADGSRIGAYPHDTPHYHVIAHRTGYGDDLLAYCREHELAHALTQELLHDRPSPILWALAHGEMPSGRAAAEEEAFAQMFQRWVRANERPIIGGLPRDAWKTRFLELVT
jgi:hypothetical protein